MKIERVKYRGGRPYIEYWTKGQKTVTRCFGEIRKCVKCVGFYFVDGEIESINGERVESSDYDAVGEEEVKNEN